MLVAELRKIEMRKKEREKKQQDLQKLITAAENQADSYRLKYVPSVMIKAWLKFSNLKTFFIHFEFINNIFLCLSKKRQKAS